MKGKVFLLSVLIAILAATGQGYAQGFNPSGKLAVGDVTFNVDFTGKIGHMTEMGGYYLYQTPEEYRIANQNPKVLEDLAKSGATVEVEGQVSRNTGFLTIEKINGKPYHGDKQPYSGQ